MNQPIKIVYFIHSSTKHEGANKSLLYSLNGLKERDISPLVVLPHEGSLCEELDQKEIPYMFVKYFMSIYPRIRSSRDILLYFPRIIRMLVLNTRARKKLIRKLKVMNVDIIHTNVGPLQIGYMVSKSLKVPHVWHIREYQKLDFSMCSFPTMGSFKRKIHDPINYPIAITNGIYNYFDLNKPARMIYNGITSYKNIQFNLEKDPYFLFVGRLEPGKGILEAIYAFSDFAKNNAGFEFIIAGDSNDKKFKNKLIQLVKRRNLANRITFLGMIDNVERYMAKATALIVPSVHEAFGRITAEAMFNGCLVIGNRTGGTKEILEKGNLGILYSGQKELAEAMHNVVKEGIEGFNLKLEYAQKYAVENFSQEKNVQNIYDYYQDIIKKRELE